MALRLAALAALLTVIASAHVAHAETITEPQEVGDEFISGHDITAVRYTNRDGLISATTWVRHLTGADRVPVTVITSGRSYVGVVHLRRGRVHAEVRTFEDGVVTCRARGRFDRRHDVVTLRMADACFPGSDLDPVQLSTGLDVRGRNIEADSTPFYVVDRS